MQIRQFSAEDEDAVVDLWVACGLTRPWNNPRLDIERKLRVQPELFLVGEIDGMIVASAMGGYDGHRGWVNYLAVAPSRRGQGWGRLIMATVEEALRATGCPKLNLQVRSDNTAAIAFYEALGYGSDEVVSLGKRLKTSSLEPE
ncbi:GNAT family acetyltransferase [Klugiella xanthotipulae]|uniref:Ribosomal protein S18 acetylase RimI-like enzyme n=2 Tax=Klugiella xanthotipulae TaxID=244735 RepID=A0A543HTD8_9MICO|nr:ribosomal protein S18 acetylase RimI-like enzyme [Klugiella xanthotipulae]